ncbi:helix-turn-helix domain-containing protein [Zafaria sp. Z1313]|uniref:helix-turn-helix domain-containing protein n=1 Tax=Zafaria sp. Z1313 TaxID=3423202 RepID=UPI003D3032A2
MTQTSDPRLAHVGGRIRSVREGHGWSLSRLAAAAGIGKGTLSELEQGARNPTLETLYALAGALGVPLASFVAGSERAPHVPGRTVDATLLDVRTLPDGTVVESYHLAIRPGRRESPGHGPGVVEHLFLVRGDAVVGRVGAGRSLRPGESWTWGSDVPHAYASEEGAEGVLTIVNPARADAAAAEGGG